MQVKLSKVDIMKSSLRMMIILSNKISSELFNIV